MKRKDELMKQLMNGLVGAALLLAAPLVVHAGPYTFTNLDFPGATSTQARGINNAGQIAGAFTDTSNKQHGFLDPEGASLLSMSPAPPLP